MATNFDQPPGAKDPEKVGLIKEYSNALRAFSPSLRRLLLMAALIFIVAFGLVAVLQNLYLLRLGFDVQFLGLLVGLGQIVFAVGAFPASMLSNRIGLRNSMMLGVGFLALGLTLMLLVEGRPESQWRAWLIFSQVVFGLGPAFIAVNIPPYIMAVTGEKERRHAFSALAVTVGVASVVGSLAAGVLSGLLASWSGFSLDQPEPYHLALWVGPILLCLAILVLAGADPARAPQTRGRQNDRGPRPFALLIFLGLVSFLAAIGEGSVRAFFNVYLDVGLKVAPAAIGTIMGVAQILPIVAAFTLPVLLARRGPGYVLAPIFLAAGFFLILLSAIPLVWVAAVAYMGVISMVTIGNTSRDMFGQVIVIPLWRTNIQSAITVGMALGWSTAGIGGGFLINANGFSAFYFVAALCEILAAGLMVGYLRRANVRKPMLEPIPASPEDTVL